MEEIQEHNNWLIIGKTDRGCLQLVWLSEILSGIEYKVLLQRQTKHYIECSVPLKPKIAFEVGKSFTNIA
jgi:hypothetical protein